MAVLHKWNKCVLGTETTTYSEYTISWKRVGGSSGGEYQNASTLQTGKLRTNYTLNRNTGQITLTGDWFDSYNRTYYCIVQRQGGDALLNYSPTDGGYRYYVYEGIPEKTKKTKTSYYKGIFIDTVVAEEGTYPNDGRSGDYWYVLEGPANTAPVISGSDLDLGGKTNNFAIEYTITDVEGDAVTVELLMDGQQIQAPTSVPLGVKQTYSVPVIEYGLGSHTFIIRANDGTDTSERQYYWEKVNAAPMISDYDRDLGEKNNSFTIRFTVDDDNPEDVITVIARLNGAEIRRWENAKRDAELSLTVTDEQIHGLVIGEQATLEIVARDTKGGENSRRYTFIRTNSPPIISGSDKNLGELLDEPTIKYTVTDIEGDEAKVRVVLDGKVVKSHEPITQDKEYEWTPSREDWLKIRPGQHTLEIVATDALNGVSVRSYTFTRNAPKLEVVAKLSDTDAAVTKINVAPIWEYGEGAKVQVFACNNYHDNEPTWEDITEVVLEERFANLRNDKKTAEAWAVGVKVIMEVGTSQKRCQLTGLGGSFS